MPCRSCPASSAGIPLSGNTTPTRQLGDALAGIEAVEQPEIAPTRTAAAANAATRRFNESMGRLLI
jgi:hypothetical protein